MSMRDKLNRYVLLLRKSLGRASSMAFPFNRISLSVTWVSALDFTYSLTRVAVVIVSFGLSSIIIPQIIIFTA